MYTITITGGSVADLHANVAAFLAATSGRLPAPGADKAADKSTGKAESAKGNTAGAKAEGAKVEPAAKDEVKPADGAVDYETVRAKVLELSVAKGRDAVMTLLQKFGAEKSAKEVKPDDYAALLAAADEAMA